MFQTCLCNDKRTICYIYYIHITHSTTGILDIWAFRTILSQIIHYGYYVCNLIFKILY